MAKKSKTNGFSKSSDILDFAYESLMRLRDGKSSTDQIKAEAKIMQNVNATVSKRFDIVKHSELMKKGSNRLPDIDFE